MFYQSHFTAELPRILQRGRGGKVRDLGGAEFSLFWGVNKLAKESKKEKRFV